MEEYIKLNLDSLAREYYGKNVDSHEKFMFDNDFKQFVYEAYSDAQEAYETKLEASYPNFV